MRACRGDSVTQGPYRGAFLALGLLLAMSGVAAAQRTIPTPESSLGFRVGDDFKLATYDESIRYFQRLAASSNRIKLLDVGKTSNGHAWTLAIISSPANLANLDRLREVAQRLAHPAGLTDAQARALAKEGKAFVDISGGLHASEIAGSQHTIQLAYDLLSRNDEKTNAILDNTVLMLWPSINPDGQNIVSGHIPAMKMSPTTTKTTRRTRMRSTSVMFSPPSRYVLHFQIVPLSSRRLLQPNYK